MSTPDPPAFAPLEDPAGGGVTLTARVAEQVRDAIADGRLQPGMRLSVPQLAEQLGASRTPVREALLLLESQGLVRFERNRGVRILETPLHDLEEIFTLRLLLEVPATRRATTLVGADELAALREHLATMRAHAGEDDETAFMAADRRFHDVLLRAAGNRRLADQVVNLRDLVRFLGASTAGRSRTLTTILGEHEAILAAVEARDADAAAAAMRAHLLATAGLLLAQEGGGGPHELAWSALPEAS
ncbi:GntR family transcriptional regulator [Patulibacter sp. SYSU D01012]|uniref:GntR family transcriptional regulator n=1 Tax=Patulibacter sp. SYSU D01012 TaxID=2817381 RepID=UPI001B313A1B